MSWSVYFSHFKTVTHLSLPAMLLSSVLQNCTDTQNQTAHARPAAKVVMFSWMDIDCTVSSRQIPNANHIIISRRDFVSNSSPFSSATVSDPDCFLWNELSSAEDVMRLVMVYAEWPTRPAPIRSGTPMCLHVRTNVEWSTLSDDLWTKIFLVSN